MVSVAVRPTGAQRCCVAGQSAGIAQSDPSVLHIVLASPQAPVGLKVRNLIGHAYAEIDPAKLIEAAGEVARLIDPFCAAVLAFATSPTPEAS